MTRIPLYLIKQELEEYGMTVEELETSAKRIKTTLETYGRSKRGDKCPNCNLPELIIFISKSDKKNPSGINITDVKAICNTGIDLSQDDAGRCGFRDEFAFKEPYSNFGQGTWYAVLNDVIRRYKRGDSKNKGKVWSDDYPTHLAMWTLMKRGGYTIGKGLGAKKISGRGVVSSMIRRTTYSGVIAKKLRDLTPEQRVEFLDNMERLGNQRAEEFLKEIEQGKVPTSSTRPRGRPKRGPGRPPARKSGEWYEPSKMTRMELDSSIDIDIDIMEDEINRINKEE